jgi:hypothetical protein
MSEFDQHMGRGQTTVNSRVATQSNVAADPLSRGVGGRRARHCVLLMKSRLLLSLTHNKISSFPGQAGRVVIDVKPDAPFTARRPGRMDSQLRAGAENGVTRGCEDEGCEEYSR